MESLRSQLRVAEDEAQAQRKQLAKLTAENRALHAGARGERQAQYDDSRRVAELEQQLKLGDDEKKHVRAQLTELQGLRDDLIQKLQESQRESRKSATDLRQEQDAKAELETKLQHMTAEVNHQRERIKDATQLLLHASQLKAA